MMRINALMIIMAAMGCGMLAAMGVSQMEALPHSQAAVAGDVQLFVAGVEVPAGELVTPQLVRLERWPRDRVPDGAVTRLQDLHQQVTRQPLLPGQPLRRNLLRNPAELPADPAELPPHSASLASSELSDRTSSRGEGTTSSVRAEPSVEDQRRTPDSLPAVHPAETRRAETSPPQSFPISKPLVVRISMSVHPHEEESGDEDNGAREGQNVLIVPTGE